MDLSKTGKLIAGLRHEKGLTQREVAQKLGICPKTVSKWETGHGFPDISLLSALSEVFHIDILKLLSGELPEKKTEVGNMKKTKFYVCEQCGNILTSVGDAQIVCCGRQVFKLIPNVLTTSDEAHTPRIELVEDEYYITFPHPMTKEHYICFVSYVRFDRVLTVRLYPEQDSALRFPGMRGGMLCYYCSQHGLFEQKL